MCILFFVIWLYKSNAFVKRTDCKLKYLIFTLNCVNMYKLMYFDEYDDVHLVHFCKFIVR